MFRLTEDFSEFYALCQARGAPWARLTAGWGRLLLRSPTVNEIRAVDEDWGRWQYLVYRFDPAVGTEPIAEALRSRPAAQCRLARLLAFSTAFFFRA
jgi:hypothetical protein